MAVLSKPAHERLCIYHFYCAWMTSLWKNKELMDFPRTLLSVLGIGYESVDFMTLLKIQWNFCYCILFKLKMPFLLYWTKCKDQAICQGILPIQSEKAWKEHGISEAKSISHHDAKRSMCRSGTRDGQGAMVPFGVCNTPSDNEKYFLCFQKSVNKAFMEIGVKISFYNCLLRFVVFWSKDKTWVLKAGGSIWKM